MFDKLRKNLYFNRLNQLFMSGLEEGRIVPFDDTLYKEMSSTYVAGLPVSIHIKYLKPIIPPGKCYDRSLYMFFCFDDALLVRGDNKDLEFKFGKDNAGHGWIERDNYVYDPTLLMRFDRDLYYKIYKPTNIIKANKYEYCSKESCRELYEDVTSTTLDDFRTSGTKRFELITTIPVLRCIAENSEDERFISELEEFLTAVNYDEVEISKDLNEKVKQLSCKRNII